MRRCIDRQAQRSDRRGGPADAHTAASPPARAAQDLGFAAGGDAAFLADVALTVAAGAPTLIIGPNGAGKSVLLRLLHGLLEPTEGRIRWGGAGRSGQPNQAMVFQRPLRRSAIANILYPLRLAGLPAKQRAIRAEQALALVGLSALADHPARRLSGGEQQRLALARAAATGAEVLFL